MNNMRFTVKEEHITLLKNMWTNWEECEFGAPAIDCKRPYGNSDVIKDMAELLKIKPDEINDWGERDFSDKLADKLIKLHKETEIALQILLCNLTIEVGTYESKYSFSGPYWTKVE